MSIENLKSQLGAKITIREANQSIKTAKEIIQAMSPHQKKEASKIWEDTKAGNPPKALMSKPGLMALQFAADEVAQLKAAKPTPAASAPVAVSRPAPVAAKPSPAQAPAKELTGFARVSAAFDKKQDNRIVISQEEYNSLTEADKADFRAANGKIS